MGFNWGHGLRRESARNCRFESLEARIALTAAPTVTNVSVGSTLWSSDFTNYLTNQGLGAGAFSIPVGSSAQATPLPWNNLNQIHITFSEDVDVDKADLNLSGKLTANYSFSGFKYTPETRTAVWTLTNVLPRDKFWIDLDGNGIDPVKDLAGNVLDGEWTNNSDTYTSGNGVAGGDFEFAFNVLVGDVNANGTVQSSDWIAANNGKTTASAGYSYRQDINGSGVINSTDQSQITSNLGRALPSGNPGGMTNDAPTTQGLAYTNITDDAIDYALSLWNAYADAETGDNLLTYSIKSNSGLGLFDSVSINSSTGTLTLNSASGATGRATITVEATDANGLKTETSVTVDVNRTNVIPVLSMSITAGDVPDEWVITGQVTDSDDNFTNMFIVLSELIEARVSIESNGQFSYAFMMPTGVTFGEIKGITQDNQGQLSNAIFVQAGA